MTANGNGKKHAGGAPRKWKSVEAMQEAIDAYFETPEPWLQKGLALHLDLTYQGWADYAARPEFAEAIQKAKDRIEVSTASLLMRGKGWGPGLIFVLKNNYGWKDVQGVEHSGSYEVHFDREDKGL